MRYSVPLAAFIGVAVLAIGCADDPTGPVSDVGGVDENGSVNEEPAIAAAASPVDEIPPFPFWARGPVCCFDGYGVVYFYNTDPSDVPSDFNFLTFFDLRALGAEWAVAGFGINDNPPNPPKHTRLHGLGAVPFWFITDTEFATVTADGIVTRPELESLVPIMGFGTQFSEVLHPTGSSAPQAHLTTTASGYLVDGGTFRFNLQEHINPTTGTATIRGTLKMK